MRIDVGALLGGTVRRLAHVDRYSSMPVARRENVAEHSFYVALFAHAIALDLLRDGVALSMTLVLRGALAHDLDETVIGDLRRPIADALPGVRDALDAARGGIVSGIGRELGVPLRDSWEIHRGDSIEGRVVALADLLGVVAYLAEELRRGNELIRGDVEEVLEVLRTGRRGFPDVLLVYVDGAHRWLYGHCERRDDVPGDRELISKLIGGDE